MPMPDARLSAVIRIEIYSWWRSGTGAGTAAQLDALCVRDCDGLPYLPGRHVKGLLRDAVRRLGQWDPAYRGADETLFGEWGFRAAMDGDAKADNDPAPYRGARPGALAMTDARMLDAERAAFVKDAEEAVSLQNGQLPLRDDLFTTLRSTALKGGVAATHTLRAEEAAAPIQLEGCVDFIGFDSSMSWSGDWFAALQAAAPLIRAVGAKRNRGLGRAAVFIEEAAQ